MRIELIQYAKEVGNALVHSSWFTAAGVVFGSLCAIRLYSRLSVNACKIATSLSGKVVVITGGNSGIGKATAMEMARRKARVIIASRNSAVGIKAVKEIVSETGNKDVEFRKLDLSSFKSVREFAKGLEGERLSILINNAGVTGPGCNRMHITEDKCEYIMQCNYFGHFLLTHCLLDTLVKNKPSRIINVSSVMYKWTKLDLNDLNSTRKYNAVEVYNKTKLALVLFTIEMSKRLDKDVTINAVHPGIVKTDIVKNTPWFEGLITRILFVLVGKSPLQGAQTTLHLALSPDLNEVSGRYFSNCKEQRISSLEEKKHLAYQLYRISERMVKLEDTTEAMPAKKTGRLESSPTELEEVADHKTQQETQLHDVAGRKTPQNGKNK